MEKETYYSIEYRRGNSWQPIVSYIKYKALKTLKEANKELGRITDLERNHAETKTVDEFRLIRYESQITTEVIKSVVIND